MPFLSIGLAVLKQWKWLGMGVLALMLAITTGRLHHAKHDLTAARAANVDPATKRPWQIEATERGRDLGTCRGNNKELTAALDRQSASVAAVAELGRQRTAEAEKALTASRTATQRAEAKGRAVLNAPSSGGDQCSRLLGVDALFVKELGR